MYERRSIYDDRESNPLMAVIVAFAAVGVMAFVLIFSGVIRLPGGESEAPSEASSQEQPAEATVTYAEADRLRMDGAIAEAQGYARNGNYGAALSTVKVALTQYPGSEELMAKFDEYAEAVNKQIEEAAEKETVQAAKEVILVSADGSGVNVRSEAAGYTVITTAGGDTELIFKGQIKKVADSSGMNLDWYYVELPDGQRGWVRSDLVKSSDGSKIEAFESDEDGAKKTEGKGYVDEPSGEKKRLISGSDVILRASSTHYSDQVAEVEAGTTMTFSGQTARGLGSDDVDHTWYYVQVEDGDWGWVRADLVTEM